MQTDNNLDSSTHGNNLGMAGNLAKSFIHSPLSPLLLLASIAIGILGLMFTPRQEDPQISVPMVDIFVSYPGASSQQVASLVADPLERIMSEIPGVKHVYSASQREQAMVTVEFDVGEDMGESLVKLYDKLESNMDRIPPGVSPPLVKPKGVDDVPLITLTLWSPTNNSGYTSDVVDDASLRLIALDVIQQLKEVPNTSQSFVVGGRTEQIRIEVYPERLAGFGISLDQIANTIRSANTQRGVGNVETNNHSFKLYTGSFLKHANDVRQLIVGLYNNQPVYLADVAQVIEGPAETKSITNFYSGKASSLDSTVVAAPAVTLAIAKKVGSNGVSVANAILEKVEYLKGRTIPDNVNVSVTRNYGETANDKVNELIFKLFVATLVVTILVWMFLGRPAATVVLIVIPVVILVTIFSAWILKFTIDRVSLFALIFSIGILVDDAIVVVENIYRRWLLNNETSTETAIDAVREVGNPTILATFTVIAALLPMAYVSGMMGPYMAPIPALGSVAMIFSLFAAFIFTPWLTMRLKPSLEQLNKAAEKEHHQSEKLERFYRRIITPLIRDRIKGLVFLVSVIGI
ncbi:MAG: efflux RND transporter permease subunit, partial [Gammaproteobacteria bacterium]